MTSKVKAHNKHQKRIKRKLRSGRGALWFIALIFAVSAAARVASGAGAAIAREISEVSQDHLKASGFDPEAGEACVSDEDTSALLDALLKREKVVEEKEFLIAQKTKAYEIAKVEIQKRLDELEAAEERLRATMYRSETAAEDDLVKLTSVYETMKPKDAAALFEAMSPEFAAGFLGRMRSDAAGAIMAGLQPETAYTISVILAGRNARAPRE